jgi:hypothetical protein
MKMKYLKYVAVYCLVTMVVSCHNYDKNAINELQLVLGDFSTSSFFIAIDVKCGNEVFPIIINNDSFYNIMLQKRLVYNQEDYTKKITKKIIKKESILFDKKDETILKNYSILENDTLNISLKENKDDIIKKYFSNNLLKTKEISYTQEKAIILSLFNNRIYCKKDCVSGSIFIVSVKPELKLER